MLIPRIMLLYRGRMTRLLFVLLCMCLFSPLLVPARVFAATNPITVSSQGDTVNFPKSIDFQITAYDASRSISQATIFIKYIDEDGYQEQHQVKAPSAAPAITLSWHEDTEGSAFAPPGTRVSYHWQLLDAAGNEYTSQDQNFTVTDSRFSWQHTSQGLLQVNWYNRPASFGQAMLNQASMHIKRISSNLGDGLNRPVDLWIYQSSDDFRGSLPPDEHEWVGGIAFPRLNVASIVVEDMQDTTLQRDMPHELTHLVFHQLINNGITAPTWFDEGLAVYHQIYHEPDMSLIFKDALAKQGLLRLDDLARGFPANTNKAYLAYAQSWNLVDYMYHTFGQSKMIALVRDMNQPQNDFDQDLQLALGVDQLHLENQWHLHLNQPPVLQPGQDAPALQIAPQTAAVTSDAQAPLLLLVGGLLIALPALGVCYLFAYQSRSRKQRRVHRPGTPPSNNFSPSPWQTPYQGPQARSSYPQHYLPPMHEAPFASSQGMTYAPQQGTAHRGYAPQPSQPPQMQPERTFPPGPEPEHRIRQQAPPYQQDYMRWYPDQQIPQE